MCDLTNMTVQDGFLSSNLFLWFVLVGEKRLPDVITVCQICATTDKPCLFQFPSLCIFHILGASKHF